MAEWVVIDGGCVSDCSGDVEVFDMDNLEYDSDVDYVVDLRDRAACLGLVDLVDRFNEWLSDSPDYLAMMRDDAAEQLADAERFESRYGA